MKRKIGVIMSGILMVFEILSTLLYTPYMIRTLGQSEYGVYTLVLSVTAYLGLLDLGVGNAIIRFVSKYRAKNEVQKQKELLGVLVIFYGVISVLVLVIGLVITEFFPNVFAKGLSEAEIALAQKLMVITVLNTAVGFISTPFLHVINAYEKFYISKGITIVQLIIRIIFCVIVLHMGLGSIGIVSVMFVLNIVLRIFVVSYVLAKMKITPVFKIADMSFIKEIVGFSAWVFLQMIATQINAMADQVLIGMFAVSASAIIAVYGVGAQVFSYFQSIAGAFNGVLMPGVVRIVENGGTAQELQKEMERIGRVILMVISLVWCVFLVFGQQFVTLWAGEANSDAYYVALLLMLPNVIILSQAIGGQILWALNKHKIQAVLKICIVATNVFLTIVLIKFWHPLMGAVIGTVISFVLGDIIVMQYVFKKEIGVKLLEYYRHLFKGTIWCLALAVSAGFAFRFFVNLNGWIGFAVNCIVMVAVYALLMYAFGMNSYEKSLVLSPVRKLKKRIFGKA